jgi:hypothetical protein
MSEIQSTTKIYDETAAQIEAAYLGFARVYEVQHPRPVMQAQNTGVFGVVHIGLAGALIGSLIVSAYHTIPIFVGKDVSIGVGILVAIATFFMIELAIVTLSYRATMNAASRNEVSRVRIFTNVGRYFIVGLAISSNLLAVFKAENAGQLGTVWQIAENIIFIYVAVSAPVIAFIIGDLLAIDVLKHNSKRDRQQEQYDTMLREWREGLNEAWNKQKGKWGANVDIQVSTPKKTQTDAPLLSSVVSSTQTDNRQTGYGYTRVSTAIETAKAYLIEHPESIDLSVRELADVIGVGKDSVARAKKELQK